MVDLSGKALAIFDRGEMEPDDLVPSVGDRFLARVHNDGGRGGLVVLTRKPLREEEIKPAVEAAAQSGELISGLVTGTIKGGVEVDISGLRAFAPASGMDLHPANANFTGLVGQRLEFKVVQYEKQGRDVVVTRRPMLESEAHERRKKALALLEEGAEMPGVVRTVVEWGAFVALPEAENLEGLVHASEISHDPRIRVADAVKPGDKFPVKITKIDEKGKIWLSRKALMQDPWAEARKKFAQGTKHHGKVVRLENFGAFIELDSDIDGLIHISDLTFKRVEHPSDVLSVGEEVDVVVRHFDLRNRKINLHPALSGEQANEPEQKVTRNARVQAVVVKGDTAGVQVRLMGVTGRGARGFIPAGQTGTQRGTDLRKHFKPGQKLDLKVIDLDPKRGEPKLSLRALKEDEERKAHREYRQKVKEEAKFGTLGDLLKAKLSLGGDEGTSK
jgi:small subunit ribosomal protein S1